MATLPKPSKRPTWSASGNVLLCARRSCKRPAEYQILEGPCPLHASGRPVQHCCKCCYEDPGRHTKDCDKRWAAATSQQEQQEQGGPSAAAAAEPPPTVGTPWEGRVPVFHTRGPPGGTVTRVSWQEARPWERDSPGAASSGGAEDMVANPEVVPRTRPAPEEPPSSVANGVDRALGRHPTAEAVPE